MTETLQDIASSISNMSFKKKLFGVDEMDILKKLESLNQQYQRLYDCQQAYYQALLEEKDQTISRLSQNREWE